jgi:DNA-binding GntR family transcriptional regulator
MAQRPARRPPTAGLASLEHWAYSQIKESIISLALPPGSTIIESELAEQLGVSKTPLRSALLQLEREGFVASAPYKGSSVTPITLEGVRHLYQLRIAIEGYAQIAVAPTLTGEDFATLENLITEQERAEEAGDSGRAAVLGRQFHGYFVERLGNPQISAIAREMADHQRRLRNAMSGAKLSLSPVRERRKPVMDALRARDATQIYQTSVNSVKVWLDLVEEAARLGHLDIADTNHRSMSRGADGRGRSSLSDWRVAASDE